MAPIFCEYYFSFYGDLALSKLRVIPTTLRKANDFVEVYHRHSLRTARNGGKFAIAAVSENEIVGVAIVGNPLSATFMDGFTAEVLRTCILPNAPRNCNSFLYGACRRIWFEMGGRKIVTYSLTYESGASLRGAGWKSVAVIKGHDSATWGKTDHLRTRQVQDIYAEAKHRWESVNENVVVEKIFWPVPTISMEEIFQ